MEDINRIFTKFKEDYPEVFQKYNDMGKIIHESAGPLDEKTRCIIKLVISASRRHVRSLKTHIIKAKEAGVSAEEIKHALLLLISTCGFPTFMEAYDILDKET